MFVLCSFARIGIIKFCWLAWLMPMQMLLATSIRWHQKWNCKMLRAPFVRAKFRRYVKRKLTKRQTSHFSGPKLKNKIFVIYAFHEGSHRFALCTWLLHRLLSQLFDESTGGQGWLWFDSVSSWKLWWDRWWQIHDASDYRCGCATNVDGEQFRSGKLTVIVSVHNTNGLICLFDFHIFKHNDHLRWCPNCASAIHCLKSSGTQNCMCACGKRFCFACGGDCHDPLPCELISKWEKVDYEAALRLTWNAEKCPKCGVLVEKDGGNNYMVSSSLCSPIIIIKSCSSNDNTHSFLAMLRVQTWILLELLRRMG